MGACKFKYTDKNTANHNDALHDVYDITFKFKQTNLTYQLSTITSQLCEKYLNKYELGVA